MLSSGMATTSVTARASAMLYCLEHQEHTPNHSWPIMPLYFFHLHGSGARDMEGQEFADEAAAIQESRLWRETFHKQKSCLARAGGGDRRQGSRRP